MGSALGSTRESRRKGRVPIHHLHMHHPQTSPSRHPPAQISVAKKKIKENRIKPQAEVENKCALNATQMTLKMHKKYVFAVALHDFMGLFPRYTFQAPFPHRSPPLHPLGFFRKKYKSLMCIFILSGESGVLRRGVKALPCLHPRSPPPGSTMLSPS